MIAFLVRRLIQSMLVMLSVALIAFSLFTYVGDPVHGMVGEDTSIDERQQLRESLGLTDPFPVQFANFVGRVVQGQFGFSYRNYRPVEELIGQRLPATLELSITAAILALLAAIPMGVYTGLHPDSMLSRFFQTVSLVGISVPTFVTGILLILVFSVMLNWLPSYVRGAVCAIGC